MTKKNAPKMEVDLSPFTYRVNWLWQLVDLSISDALKSNPKSHAQARLAVFSGLVVSMFVLPLIFVRNMLGGDNVLAVSLFVIVGGVGLIPAIAKFSRDIRWTSAFLVFFVSLMMPLLGYSDGFFPSPSTLFYFVLIVGMTVISGRVYGIAAAVLSLGGLWLQYSALPGFTSVQADVVNWKMVYALAFFGSVASLTAIVWAYESIMRRGIDDYMNIAEALSVSNEALRQSKLEAEDANYAKSRFLAAISHEIRTPLNAIVGFSDVLRHRDQHPVSSVEDEYLGYIQRAGMHLSELVQNALDYANLESGTIQVRTEPVQIVHVIEDVVAAHQLIAEDRHVDVEIAIDEQLPAWIEVDRMKLQQILSNLLSNAIKYTLPDTTVTIRAGAAYGELSIAIADRGAGISPENLNKIFDQFQQIERNQARPEGAGLGLSIAKRLAIFLGGDLLVSSTLDVGSRFEVLLPFADVDPDEVEDIQRTDVIKLNVKSNTKILVVEDNPINVAMLRATMAQFNVEFYHVDNGQLGIEAIREIRPDCVLMDIHMPVMDGITAVEIIRTESANADIPILMLSADSNDEQIEAAIAAGADGYLVKPVNRQQFAKMLNQLLDPSQLIDHNTDVQAIPEDQLIDAERFGQFDPELRRELIGLFNLHVADDMQSLARAIKLRRFSEINDLTHKLKGSSVGIAALQMHAQATALQAAAQQQNTEQIQERFRVLQSAYAQTRDYLNTIKDGKL